MSTSNIPSAVSSSAPLDRSSGSPADQRAKLATLAAEFESLLLVNVLRDMRTSGRWSEDGGADTLGADTFQQTLDVELSRYLANTGGVGLSQRLLEAFDAIQRAFDTVGGGIQPGAPPYNAFTPPGTAAPPHPFAGGGAATGGAYAPTNAARLVSHDAGRTGWNGLRLDAPPPGGSGAEWGGFNHDRALAGSDEKSVKDAFFRWTYGLSFNPAGRSKQEIESFLRSNVQNAREYGLNILDVQGDAILIETKERGLEWVDVVQAAGSTNPSETRWQWLCQYDEGVATGGGALGAALAELRSSAGAERARQFLASTPLVGDSLITGMRAEAAAAARGEAPSYERRVAAPEPQPVPAPAPTAPVQLAPPESVVTSNYGLRQDPFTGMTRFHRGIDLRAAEGDPVATTGAGRVVFSGPQGGYGTTVVVEHANGLSTRYAHLSAALVGVGDEVAQGQLIGRAGQTGRATAPHVHYEVMVDGRPVDPLQY